MRTLSPRLAVGMVLSACGLAGTAAPASAAWNNVFQVCCNDCSPPVTSYSAPACPDPCPQPEVRVSYVQRCYYQPVTSYVRKSYYEPVTRKVTSYYYEPVTSYRYSTYYDPCTGCPQKVCTPCTSYRLRSKCNSVTSYVERCAMVPVTSYRQVTVRQPVVSYYYPPEPACPPTSAGAAFAPPAGPSVEQIRQDPPSVYPESGGSNIPNPMVPTQPQTYPRSSPARTPAYRPEKTVSLTRSEVVSVRGEVVHPDQLTPRPGAKLVFVNAADLTKREYATANRFGEFDTRLAAGDWYVYLDRGDGNAAYHKKVSLGDRQAYDYKVVSR